MGASRAYLNSVSITPFRVTITITPLHTNSRTHEARAENTLARVTSSTPNARPSVSVKKLVVELRIVTLLTDARASAAFSDQFARNQTALHQAAISAVSRIESFGSGAGVSSTIADNVVESGDGEMERTSVRGEASAGTGRYLWGQFRESWRATTHASDALDSLMTPSPSILPVPPRDGDQVDCETRRVEVGDSGKSESVPESAPSKS